MLVFDSYTFKTINHIKMSSSPNVTSMVCVALCVPTVNYQNCALLLLPIGFEDDDAMDGELNIDDFEESQLIVC